MTEDIAIKVENVSKYFKLPHDRANTIKASLINFARRKNGYDIQHALENINFEVRKGEFYGIVGKNGSGKSTLLKIISGIYQPTKGQVAINGKLTPFIELGVGFNQELTGRENIFLNGSLLGFDRKEMRSMYADIVSFAGLEKFMDQKLKNYSSGMQVRLAFSIAIRAQSDILVMDEVLAVGDSEFQQKCFNVFRELKKEKKTIILVTHDMSNVERFCDRVLVLDNGRQLKVTTPAEAASIYSRLNVEAEQLTEKKITGESSKKVENKQPQRQRWGDGGIRVKDVILKNSVKETKIFSTGEKFNMLIKLNRDSKYRTTPIVCGLAFFNQDGHVIIGPNSTHQKLKDGCQEVSFCLDPMPFAPGKYAITVGIFDEDGINSYDFQDKWYEFSVISNHTVHGLVEINSIWRSA